MTVAELLSIWKTEMPINLYVGMDAINPRKYGVNNRDECLKRYGCKEVIEVRIADNFGKSGRGVFRVSKDYPNLLIIKTSK